MEVDIRYDFTIRSCRYNCRVEARSRTRSTRSVCLMPRADRVLLNDFQDDSMGNTHILHSRHRRRHRRRRSRGACACWRRAGSRSPPSAFLPRPARPGWPWHSPGSTLEVEEAKLGVFGNLDLAFFAAGGTAARALAPDAVKAGCLVIDKSSAFRLDPDVPLVIPEINPQALERHKGIIANPNCSTAVALMGLWPLHRRFGLKRYVVATYQSVSGAGRPAVGSSRRRCTPTPRVRRMKRDGLSAPDRLQRAFRRSTRSARTATPARRRR